MVLDGSLNLRTLDRLCGDVAHGFAKFEHVAVLEFDELVARLGADVVDDPAGFIIGVFSAFCIQIIAGLYSDGLAFLRAVLLTYIDGELGLERICRRGFQSHVSTVEVFLRHDRIHANSLDKSPLERIHRCQAVNLVVALLVRG